MSEQTASAAETVTEPENLESLFSDKANDAPIQHLIDKVYRSGYNLKKVIPRLQNN